VKVVHFETQAEFRAWLETHHRSALELWVGFYKKDSGRKGITYAEALDEALCFGWIDGIKKSVDALSYTNRFTPRKARSTWSLINTKRAKELIRGGLMAEAGLVVFKARDPARTGIYSFENRPRTFDPASARTFRAEKSAWTFFQAQPPGYRRVATWWVMNVKKEETRARRLRRLMADSAARRRLAVITGSSKTNGR
jgi:uncharacterized protein YdeI (YjbR/CyaY-like superfamily)